MGVFKAPDTVSGAKNLCRAMVWCGRKEITMKVAALMLVAAVIAMGIVVAQAVMVALSPLLHAFGV